jgi:hypothetical protein
MSNIRDDRDTPSVGIGSRETLVCLARRRAGRKDEWIDLMIAQIETVIAKIVSNMFATCGKFYRGGPIGD